MAKLHRGQTPAQRLNQINEQAAMRVLFSFMLLLYQPATPVISESLTKWQWTEALPSKQHRPDVAEQFSLLFKASDLSPIESRIHQLHHPVLGSLELFISPVGAKPGVGEAIINYARQAA